MSYILEALKKADQERDVGGVPNLTTPQEVTRPKNHSHQWIWLTVALLSVNVVLAFMLLHDSDEDSPVTAEASLERQPGPTSDQSAQPSQQASEFRTVAAPTPERTTVPEIQAAPSGGQVVVLPQRADVRNSESSPLPEAEPVLGMGAVTSPRDTSQLPNWYELPPELRNRLDLPRLDIHAYSEQPQNRFILVNLKKYREGEWLESGLLLEEILPDGMVMSYQGERFLVDK